MLIIFKSDLYVSFFTDTDPVSNAGVYSQLFFWLMIYIVHLVLFSVFSEQNFHNSFIVFYPDLCLFVQCDI